MAISDVCRTRAARQKRESQRRSMSIHCCRAISASLIAAIRIEYARSSRRRRDHRRAASRCRRCSAACLLPSPRASAISAQVAPACRHRSMSTSSCSSNCSRAARISENRTERDTSPRYVMALGHHRFDLLKDSTPNSHDIRVPSPQDAIMLPNSQRSRGPARGSSRAPPRSAR